MEEGQAETSSKDVYVARQYLKLSLKFWAFMLQKCLSGPNNCVLSSLYYKTSIRECVRVGAVGAQTRRSLGHHLLHPLILRLLVLCAPAVLRTRALQDAPAPVDPNF